MTTDGNDYNYRDNNYGGLNDHNNNCNYRDNGRTATTGTSGDNNDYRDYLQGPDGLTRK